MINKKFSRLLVVSISDVRKDNKISWNCVCDCGIKKIVTGKSLRIGNTKSCGCLQKEKAKISMTKYVLENPPAGLKHGLCGTKIYQCWKNIKARCDKKNNTHYMYYGGRGITYDSKWKTFEGFYKDMKNGYSEKLTIERINVNGNYCKKNCKWIMQKRQAYNRRSNHFITHLGKTLTVQEWAELLNIPRVRINNRILSGHTDPHILLYTGKFAGNNHKGIKTHSIIVQPMSKKY